MPKLLPASRAFQVRRDNLRECRVFESAIPQPNAGEVVLKIDRFALTANNIAYAAFGERMQYWNFFPAPANTPCRCPQSTPC